MVIKTHHCRSEIRLTHSRSEQLCRLLSVQMAQARLYNCNAICFMRMGEWAEADKALQEAFAKDAKNADTVANLIVSGLRCGKNVSRYTK